ncbi:MULTISPECIES: TSUP family transporter [unclassified Rathayibacter]|uniref:TSUP family transporter n=1 Tax=unclassified Rathayibacter TaxID=2609250 RepID=UPI00188BE84D|nr:MULTISPECIES: TSUP family transporter [unclassified Rathayibacter]MBF4461511.1 TSUP family transporter [Rathayibacter sp. VKM Ac-2879]MBF4502922.1 TSUP family transporter [Rathayibacter sp. VKM Ac-2878]
MLTFTDDLGLAVLALMVLAAFAAGWIDAVVGGGGLLQLPALLLVPGISPVQALATNKLASVFGTTTSAITFFRRARPDLRTALPMAAVALVGSYSGANLAGLLPASVFKPIIVVALVVVAVVTIARPALGSVTALKHAGRRHLVTAAVLGLLIGFYDGLIGPGTGTFLIIALITALGYDFVLASAKAKIVNVATNVGALLFFVPGGHVIGVLGLLMGLANVAGAYLGSRMAVARGSRFIRVAFLLVVGALIVKLGVDVWTENLAPLLA